MLNTLTVDFHRTDMFGRKVFTGVEASGNVENEMKGVEVCLLK